MIKAIIFDLWETLGTKNIGISKTLMEHFHIEKTSDFMLKYESSIQLHKWKNEEEMAINFLKSFNLPTSEKNIRFVVETLRKGIDKAILFDGIKELLKTLKSNYKLGILSNTTIFESAISHKLNIADLFDAQVYSWQINSLKPSKKNFDEICRQLKASPQECIFIDDGEKNTKAAASYGFKAIQYQDISQLKSELKALGIIIK